MLGFFLPFLATNSSEWKGMNGGERWAGEAGVAIGGEPTRILSRTRLPSLPSEPPPPPPPPPHLQSEINPTREHRKWVKSPVLRLNPHSGGILVGGKATWLTHVRGEGLGGAREMERRAAWLRKAERKKLFFFSLWSSIGSSACCLVTAAPFEKHSVSLEISLKIHSQSAYQTFLLTIGQQHAI